MWYAIHVNFIFSVFFWTNVQSNRTTRAELEDHLWSADHSLRNAVLDVTSFWYSGGWTEILGHYHVVCKVIASFTASEHSHQNKRAKAGQQLFRTKVVSGLTKFPIRSCWNRTSMIMFFTKIFWLSELFLAMLARYVQNFSCSKFKWNDCLTCIVVYLFICVGVCNNRGEFRLRQIRQLRRAVDLKGRLLSCQSY